MAKDKRIDIVDLVIVTLLIFSFIMVISSYISPQNSPPVIEDIDFIETPKIADSFEIVEEICTIKGNGIMVCVRYNQRSIDEVV